MILQGIYEALLPKTLRVTNPSPHLDDHAPSLEDELQSNRVTLSVP